MRPRKRGQAADENSVDDLAVLRIASFPQGGQAAGAYIIFDR